MQLLCVLLEYTNIYLSLTDFDFVIRIFEKAGFSFSY